MGQPLILLSGVTLNVQVVNQVLWSLYSTVVGVYQYSEQLLVRINDKETFDVYVWTYVVLLTGIQL